MIYKKVEKRSSLFQGVDVRFIYTTKWTKEWIHCWCYTYKNTQINWGKSRTTTKQKLFLQTNWHDLHKRLKPCWVVVLFKRPYCDNIVLRTSLSCLMEKRFNQAWYHYDPCNWTWWNYVEWQSLVKGIIKTYSETKQCVSKLATDKGPENQSLANVGDSQKQHTLLYNLFVTKQTLNRQVLTSCSSARHTNSMWNTSVLWRPLERVEGVELKCLLLAVLSNYFHKLQILVFWNILKTNATFVRKTTKNGLCGWFPQ